MYTDISRSVDRGFAYFESFTNLERDAGQARTPMRLERMQALLAAFGNPERAFRAIHIAGSKGKGSTAAFLENILRAAGYRVGVYTSPHVRSYRERIGVHGQPADDGVLNAGLERIRSHVERRYRAARRDHPHESRPLGAASTADGSAAETSAGSDGIDSRQPTTFELLTLLAFIVFRETACEWAVVETGLGGRLDATNVLVPAACLITPIEREHVEYLGDRLEQIAAEKAGIIKPGVPVFCSKQPPEVAAVIRARAAQCSAPLHELAAVLCAADTLLRREGMRLRLQLKGYRELSTTLRLMGSVQAENAALAAYCVLQQFPEITAEQIAQGLSAAWLPARGELLETTPPVMIDGAHTAASVASVCAEFRSLFPGARTLVFGAVRGKNYSAMAAVLAPAFDHVIIARPGRFKPSDLDELAAAFSALHPRVEVHAEPDAAWQAARRHGCPALVTGSFYLASELHAVLDTQHHTDLH